MSMSVARTSVYETCKLSVVGWLVPLSRFHARPQEMRSTYMIPTTVSWFTSTAGWLSLANDA